MFCFFLIISNLHGCSCSERIYLCDYIQEYEGSSILVLEVKLEKFIDHSEDLYEAEFIIRSKVREDVSVNSRFRLLSSNNDGDCTIKFKRNFELDSIYVIAIVIDDLNGYNGYEGISHNQQSEDLLTSDPNIWRFYPSLCYFRSIEIQEKFAKGWITEDIFHYPTNEFLANLKDCNLEFDVRDSFYCNESEYQIFPNPSYNRDVFIKSDFGINSFDSVLIFDSSGRRISSFQLTSLTKSLVRFEFEEKGIYFIRLKCRNNYKVFKLVSI